MSKRDLSFLGWTHAGDEGSDVNGQVMTYSVSQTTSCRSTSGDTTNSLLRQWRLNQQDQVRDMCRDHSNLIAYHVCFVMEDVA